MIAGLMPITHPTAQFAYLSPSGYLAVYPLGVISKVHGIFEPELSPDRQEIVYWRELSPNSPNCVIEVMTLATNKVRKIRAGDLRSPRFSPSGKELVFTEFVSTDWSLYRVSAKGGKPKLCLSTRYGVFRPSWNKPNEISAQSSVDYYIVSKGKVSKKSLDNLGNPPGMTSSGDCIEPCPIDTRKIAYSGLGEVDDALIGSDGKGSALYMTDLDFRTYRRITPKSMFVVLCRWARDGKTIIFAGTQNHPSGIRQGIFSIEPSGQNMKYLTAGTFD